MIASAQRVVARYHAATQLQMTPGKVDSKGTESLRAMSKLYAKNRGDLSGAVISAGYYADRMGKTMYAYPGDSYGHGVWRVTYKASEFLDPINNSGRKLISVTPDLTVAWHDVH